MRREESSVLRRSSASARAFPIREAERAEWPCAVGLLVNICVILIRESANLYSLVRCARVNGLELYAYLLHLLDEFPKASTAAALEALLPWNVKPLLKAS